MLIFWVAQLIVINCNSQVGSFIAHKLSIATVLIDLSSHSCRWELKTLHLLCWTIRTGPQALRKISQKKSYVSGQLHFFPFYCQRPCPSSDHYLQQKGLAKYHHPGEDRYELLFLRAHHSFQPSVKSALRIPRGLSDIRQSTKSSFWSYIPLPNQSVA